MPIGVAVLSVIWVGVEALVKASFIRVASLVRIDVVEGSLVWLEVLIISGRPEIEELGYGSIMLINGMKFDELTLKLITDHLCQELQSKSQDILSAMHLVSSTKAYIQQYKDDKWDDLFTNMKSFCEKRNIDVSDMNAHSQLQELNRRFSEHAVDLLIFGSTLDPRAALESFIIDDICQLGNKFYPQDFTDLEKEQLEIELNHYKHNVVLHSSFQALSNIYELCQWLVSTGKSTIYQLVFRVIVLVLTFPISTTTIEQAFSAMDIVKTKLRNKIEDEFLTDSLMVYMEREVAATINIDSIINDFRDSKKRRVPF
ncbi:uncharacterized protein LOC133866142 [Alnus glutinosa]|uniref:uncharacterized protein LOC133866142 n=1 Tax=Alnus glutinosa TaxID=3517 RepID=UPI002D7A1A51|nr:uncharacterized protein LOC133866142 [Alnus glutinosa]